MTAAQRRQTNTGNAGKNANRTMAAAESMTGSEYVAHHLRHLASSTQNGLFDPSVLHYDTVTFSLLTAALVLIVMRLVAARATSGVPGASRRWSSGRFKRSTSRPRPWCRSTAPTPRRWR